MGSSPPESGKPHNQSLRMANFAPILEAVNDGKVYKQYEQQLQRVKKTYSRYEFKVEPLGISKGYLISQELVEGKTYINYKDSALNEEFNILSDSACMENAFLYFGARKPVWLWFASINDFTAMVVLISEFRPEHERIWEKHRDELHWYGRLISIKKQNDTCDE